MISLFQFKNTFLLLLFLGITCSNQKVEQKVSAETTATEQIITGANRTEAYLPYLKDKKVAVVANQTSVIFRADHTDTSPSYTHLVDSLLSLDIAVQKVFAPEHGFRGRADAGEKVADGKDAQTGLPIVSLYGKNRKPSAEQLQGVDLIVFDIQDVGVRFYTYISTLHYVMEAASEHQIPVLVLDRPNPNGNYVDGPTLEPEHQSFLGMHPIPLVHGMTIGEYAQMINGEKWLENGKQAELRVIGLKNYNRNMAYHLPIRPSPNLPNDQSIALYPSLGLFEGTTINAGRGTEYQFQRYGAPELDSTFFEFNYVPEPNFGAKHPKHEGKLCYGEDLSNVAVPNEVDLSWIIRAYNHSGDKENFFRTASFTKHAGTAELQKQIESGMSAEEISKGWEAGVSEFLKKRSAYLLYQ
ncbi:exo-beta-N-acetylmuramidase NamZ family protein [Robertkochia aurantiaca]|uniref:exo-beta-N-acetylmuramidase NamZ family protein n=1 Tax=Robertkochia aurantiaca TaxID=2873700 RepID=UPI001CCEFA1E|nr:DUF1343 domain-containing protein [Robertkochia sp. 3YJGBD-33]